jgi:hypothetical protein
MPDIAKVDIGWHPDEDDSFAIILLSTESGNHEYRETLDRTAFEHWTDESGEWVRLEDIPRA